MLMLQLLQIVVESSFKRRREEMMEGTSDENDNSEQWNWMTWKAKKTCQVMERSGPNYLMI